MKYSLFIFLFFVNQSVSKIERNDDKGSLVFVFDTTGSMFDDLRQLREGAEMILDAALEDSSSIANFVFVPFHDPAVGPATVTKNKHLFKNALNIVRVYGGGDCPERSLSGIIVGLENSLPNSQVYVFTDASATDHNRLPTALDLLQRTQSQVVFVLTGHCNDLKKPSYQVYHTIAAASAGQVFNLNKTSVHNVLDFVRSSLKGRKVNLGSIVNKPGYNQIQKIPIDNNLEEVTVSVSGIKPQIKVTNPKGEELDGPPKLVTALDLNEIMIVKVLQPEPGNWTITVGSEKDHSVKVMGLSNITFHHGFSVEKPKSLAETSYRPLQGTYNHMLISLAGPPSNIELNYVEILSLDGKTLFEVPLHELSDSKMYLADAFLPPDDLFYIAVNGHDMYGQELRRVGATAVQAKQPDVPYLKTPKMIEARLHDTVILECHIESLVPITALWTLDNRRIQEQRTSLQSFTVEYTIDDLTEANTGTYTCSARNVAGSATAHTQVVMLVDPPQILLSPDNATLQPGSDVHISCTVFTEALLTKFQLVFSGSEDYAVDVEITPSIEGVYVFNKTLNRITEANQGRYTCIASNRGGETNHSTYITLTPKPITQILGPHTLMMSIYSPVQLVCQTENAKIVRWTDEYNNELKVEKANGSHVSMFDIVNVTNDGSWTCTGLNDFYNSSDSVKLKVLVKPKVSIEGPKDITLLNGTSYEVTCNVVANPAPRIIWHKETEKFLDNIITVPSPHHYKSALTINSTDDSTNRTYFCFGENSEGIAHASISVYVRRKMEVIQGFTDTVTDYLSKVTLYCKIDAYPQPQISWYHNNTKIQPNENIKVIENNTILQVLKVDFQDLGDYSCEASNGYENVYVNGSLGIHDLEKPALLKEPLTRIAEKGTTTKITCRIIKGIPKPSLSWLFKINSSEFSSLPSDVLQTDNRQELIISNVKISHEGVYRCLAENIIGSDVYDTSLVVHFPPEFKNVHHLEEETAVKTGTKLTLSCEAIGSPAPEVVWNKDGYPVVYTKNVYLNDNNDLVIEKSTVSESGVYTCTAVSILGTQNRDIIVKVYEPPIIMHSEIDPVIDVLEGQLVELPCRATGIPTPKVVWSQNSASLTRRKYVDDFGIRFVANLTDFGEYTCLAQNKYENASLTYLVQVWVPPSIAGPMRSSTNALTGLNSSLDCDAVGFPVPTVLWEFQGRMLAENTSSVRFNEIGNIYFYNLTSKNEGLYACVAENMVGIARKFTYLNVHELPKIISDNYLGPYIATNTDTVLYLPCLATGKPKPYVMWSKDGTYLDTDDRFEIDSDGTLTIKFPSEELSGDYICMAKNLHGFVNKTTHVNIYSIPTRIQSEEARTSMHAVEGKNLSITCPVMTLQNDTVKWYKDATLLSTDSLKFKNVSRLNASSYACVVSNNVYTTYHTVELEVEWQPTFVNNSTKYIEVVNGEDVFLDCEVDAKPVARTKWYFKSRILFGEESSRLLVKNVKQNSAGLYKCVVSNNHGTAVKEFLLEFTAPPFISEFDILDVELMEGTNATLDCNSKGFPTPIIEWNFNNTHWQVQNTSLKSINITSKAEGIFRCSATNKAGSSHLVYRVKVVNAPVVTEIVLFKDGEGNTVQRRAEIVLGTRIRLSCYTTGKPWPKIQWIKNGVVLADSGQNLKSINDTYEHIPYVDFIIESVQSGVAGEFICIASNEFGSDQKIIQIDVLVPPKIFQNLFQSSPSNITNVEVLSGQAFFLHCHPYGYPIPVVYWFKDGISLKLFDQSMVSEDFGETLVSNKALVEQSGNYTCVARNKAGNTSVVYMVDVLVPPQKPKDYFKNVTFRVGSPLNLTCPVQGSPMPYVVWVKEPYVELSEDIPRIKLFNDNYTLVINTTQISDTGNYSCIMTNKVGTTEFVYNVIIVQPPYILSESGGNAETHVVPLKRSLVLKCEVKGHPEPKITWLKNTQPLSESSTSIHRVLSGRVLTFWSVNIEDGAQYICLAENLAGTTHRRYNVIVKVPGKWTPFSSWSFCNTTCGLGYQQRERNCHFIDDFNNVVDKTSKTNYLTIDESTCKGLNIDRRKCHMPPCEEDTTSFWSSWSKWSICSSTCGVGTQSRTRRCRSRASCQGDNVQIRKCPGLPVCDTNRTVYAAYPSVDEDSENESFMPEVTFELQPEVIDQTRPEIEQHFTPGMTPSSFYKVNVTENIDKSYRGHCDVGFSFNNKTQTCEDIDECLINNNHCHMTQICINSNGGYKCGCPEGYASLGVGQRCLDMNECELDAHRCEFACVNTAGGYVCACPSHLRLHIDRHHCVIPSMARSPLPEHITSEYLSTSIELPSRYRNTRN